MTQETQLVHFDAARQELALATSIDEIKTIRDKAEALRQYIKQQGASLEMQNQAAEIKLRAERRAGEMLKDREPHPPGPEPTVILHDVMQPPTLKELGITPIQSYRWQLEASIPEDKFEAFVAETKAETEELTSKSALKLARLIRSAESKECQIAINKPKGVYRTIVIDPPWPVEKIEREVRPNQHEFDYPTMSLDQIKAIELPVDETGCHIYLWATQKYIPAAFELFDVWGIKYQCLLTWVKNVGFTPFSWMYSTEHILFGHIGSLPLQKLGVRLDFNAKVREHSRKPDEFYDIVKLVSPEPRIDYFSREKRGGFDQYGNETTRF